MRLRDFVRKHRAELDASIRAKGYNGGRNGRLNDGEREDWIRNDEGLYMWARREGVPL